MKPALVGVAVALGACAGDAELTDCNDDLAGVWHEVGADDHGFHFLPSRSGGYEVFAMFDTARPPDGGAKLASPVVYAPWVWDLERHPSGISGTRLQRMTRAGKSCAARTPVEVRSCAGGRLTVAAKVATAMDFDTCTATAGAWIPLVLHR